MSKRWKVSLVIIAVYAAIPSLLVGCLIDADWPCAAFVVIAAGLVGATVLGLNLGRWISKEPW